MLVIFVSCFQFIKKLVLAWDPDYTKLTREEAQQLDNSLREMANGEYVSHDDMDWE